MVKIPKRNKSKDNPYVLGYDENKKIYTVEFVDNKKIIHKIEISNEVYEAFNKFELEDISQIHKYRSHIEHSILTEKTLFQRMIISSYTIEEEVEQTILYESLYKAINTLTETQRKRIKMYYFDELTLQEIADLEGCSIKNVFKSLELAKEKLKQILKK